MDQEVLKIQIMMMMMYLCNAAECDPSNPENNVPEDERQQAYAKRNRQLWQAAGFAASGGLPVGIGYDFGIGDAGDAWPVLYIELPTGQVSWQMPPHPEAFDGHDTAEKYRRIWEFADQTPTSASRIAEAMAEHTTGTACPNPDCDVPWHGHVDGYLAVNIPWTGPKLA